MVGANRQDASLTVGCQPLSQRHASAALVARPLQAGQRPWPGPRSAEGRHDLGGGTCPVAEGLRDHPPVRVPNHRPAASPTPGAPFRGSSISRSFSRSWPSTSSLC